jgi:predicted MPP superfamily phosphohydrolase
MAAAVQLTLLLIALFGHGALWVGLVNRIHSTGMPRWAVKWLSWLCLVAVLSIPVVLAALARSEASLVEFPAWIDAVWRHGRYYFLPCIAIAAAVTILWTRRRLTFSVPAALRVAKTEEFDVVQALGFRPVHGRFAQLCSRAPWNQAFQPRIELREFEFSRLPMALDGVSIVHLSDFHFTGRVGIEYFQEVVRRANALQPDLIALTGDLVDHAECIDWLPETLGRLKAPLGVFFILGNHDLRTRDVKRLRQTLADLGLVDLGGQWRTLDVRGELLLLAGNELPWIAPAADMRAYVSKAVGADHDRPFRILLSHSPDQFEWAQRWDFDLVLAGHTHGGQFCLPWIGPLLSPSWYGVQYAGGTFAAGKTVMHVSRGTSGEVPLRWNAPPEVGRIVLRSCLV